MSQIAKEIKCCAKRAFFLGGASVNESFVESFWKIKEDLFDAQTRWEHNYGVYPESMRADLKECHDNLQECWHKIVEAGLY